MQHQQNVVNFKEMFVNLGGGILKTENKEKELK